LSIARVPSGTLTPRTSGSISLLHEQTSSKNAKDMTICKYFLIF